MSALILLSSFFIENSTNVYEEQSLGVFHDIEDEFETSGPRMSVWSRYMLALLGSLHFASFLLCGGWLLELCK